MEMNQMKEMFELGLKEMGAVSGGTEDEMWAYSSYLMKKYGSPIPASAWTSG